jgi:hypothetical protein
VLTPPFAIRISQLTGLPYRQTPLLLSDPTYASIRLVLRLPKGAAAALPGAADIRDGDRAIAIRDRQEGAALVLDRVVSIPAGRVRPDEYKALQQFARQGDDATMRDVVIQLP